MQARGRRKVASGVWLYDGAIAMPIAIWAKPASQSATRYDDDDQLIDARPVPKTNDGFLYCPVPGRGEFLTIEDAKASADAEPWGPVKWD